MTNRTTRKDSLILTTLATLLVVAGFWVAYQFVEPAPPSRIVISSGSESGTYFSVANQYRAALAQNGIDLEVLPSAGSGENIKRLLDRTADVALVQSGSSDPDDQSSLLSLGSLYYEPIWLFMQNSIKTATLSDLKNKKIAIGQEGSGTRKVVLKILEKNGFSSRSENLLSLSSEESAEALLQGTIDAAFVIASIESPLIQELLHERSLALMNFSRAEAYTRLYPFLTQITLPEGIVDFEKNIPGKSTTLLAATANLVAHKDLHPALSVLLMQAAKKTHSGSTLFAKGGFFPSPSELEFPLSDVADRFYQNGPPFLMRYLPFWAAILIDRMVVMLIPLVALMIPLMKVMPPVYRWRVRSRIYRWYRELQAVDDLSHGKQLSSAERDELEKELERIENEVNKVKTPLSYADQLYHLLVHIELVRNKVTGTSDKPAQ